MIICPVGFLSCFAPVFVSMTFWNDNVYLVMLEICDLHFDFDCIEITIKGLPEFEKRL